MNSDYNNNNQNSQTPTIPCHIRKLLHGQCDSATLSLYKFPTFIGKQPKPSELVPFCKQIKENQKHLSAPLSLPNIAGAASFTATNKGRLLVNHTGGILESNLAFHRFFNCPVIPGSALKGIARSAASCDEDKERFSRVFGGKDKGCSDQAGSVAFLMAHPENNSWEIVVDVLTSHGGCDTKNPIPVFFLAVEKGAKFRFTVAPTSRCKDGDLEFAVKYLKTALADYGVGAKTAAGYGWFEITGDK